MDPEIINKKKVLHHINRMNQGIEITKSTEAENQFPEFLIKLTLSFILILIFTFLFSPFLIADNYLNNPVAPETSILRICFYLTIIIISFYKLVQMEIKKIIAAIMCLLLSAYLQFPFIIMVYNLNPGPEQEKLYFLIFCISAFIVSHCYNNL